MLALQAQPGALPTLEIYTVLQLCMCGHCMLHAEYVLPVGIRIIVRHHLICLHAFSCPSLAPRTSVSFLLACQAQTPNGCSASYVAHGTSNIKLKKKVNDKLENGVEIICIPPLLHILYMCPPQLILSPCSVHISLAAGMCFSAKHGASLSCSFTRAECVTDTSGTSASLSILVALVSV